MGKRRVLTAAATAISLGGALVSGYLLSVKLQAAPMFCLTGGGCETVNASPYSEFLGIPVSAFGLAVYLAVAAMAAAWTRWASRVSEWIPLLAFGLTLFGFLYSAYLTYLEAFVLYAYCSWCLTSFALIAANLVLITAALRMKEP